MQGTVLSFDSSKSRYAVEVGNTKILLKLGNLSLDSVEDVPLPHETISSVGNGFSKHTYLEKGASAPAAEAASVPIDYDALLSGLDFAVLRETLLRAASRPGCAPMPGRKLSDLPNGRACLPGIIGVLQRSSESSRTLVQQACDGLSKMCCSAGGAYRQAVRQAGAAPALVHAIKNVPAARSAPAPAADAADAAADVSADVEADGAADGAGGESELLVPRAVCLALANLANGDLACKLAVAQADGATAIVDAMRTYVDDEQFAKIGVGGLANIGNGDETCLQVRARSRYTWLPTPLPAVLTAGTRPCARDRRAHCVRAVSIESRVPVRQAVLNAKGVRQVVLALKKHAASSAPLAADGCLALANFAAGKGAGADAVVDGGGVEALLLALRAHGSTEPRVKEWGCAALANLASCSAQPDVIEALIDAGACRAAVAALEHCNLPAEVRATHLCLRAQRT